MSPVTYRFIAQFALAPREVRQTASHSRFIEFPSHGDEFKYFSLYLPQMFNSIVTYMLILVQFAISEKKEQ